MEDSNVALLIERIQQPHILRDLTHPKKKVKVPRKTSKAVLMLLHRLQMREWLNFIEGQLIEAIIYLRGEVKFIEHLYRCETCKVLLKLDVERYNGTRSLWYLCLENSEYLEAEYPDCPREENYVIDNYWAQVERCRKTGTTECTETNTLKFIMDRAKWAYKIMGKQINLTRKMLRLVKSWDFSDRIIREFNRLYEELAMYEIANPPSFSTVRQSFIRGEIVATLRSEYGFDQFEFVLQKLAHEIAIDAVTNLKQGRVRIDISGNRFQRVETDKYMASFYANHIAFSRHTLEYWGFDVEEKEYTTSNHRTKISFFVQVDGKYNEDTGEYVEIGRAEKEHKRSEEILTFIQELMTKAGMKPVPRFTLQHKTSKKN